MIVPETGITFPDGKKFHQLFHGANMNLPETLIFP